mmetsp:Transcript_15742/g.44130  ORF Transcript_15742/g.44130 Transcript_15742/m.44130 type:complete len:311 (-) Transcript_15742:257-1189(-)
MLQGELLELVAILEGEERPADALARWVVRVALQGQDLQVGEAVEGRRQRALKGISPHGQHAQQGELTDLVRQLPREVAVQQVELLQVGEALDLGRDLALEGVVVGVEELQLLAVVELLEVAAGDLEVGDVQPAQRMLQLRGQAAERGDLGVGQQHLLDVLRQADAGLGAAVHEGHVEVGVVLQVEHLQVGHVEDVERHGAHQVVAGQVHLLHVPQPALVAGALGRVALHAVPVADAVAVVVDVLLEPVGRVLPVQASGLAVHLQQDGARVVQRGVVPRAHAQVHVLGGRHSAQQRQRQQTGHHGRRRRHC